MTFFFPLVPQGKFEFLPAEGCVVWYVAVFGYLYLPGQNGKSRDQNFEDSEKALESEFGFFPRLPTSVAICTIGHRPVEVYDTVRYQWPPGDRPMEVYDTDRYQWPPGHHWWPMVVSAAEGRSPNACVDSAPYWREAASTILATEVSVVKPVRETKNGKL